MMIDKTIIHNEEITNILKACEIGVAENKPLNDESYYFLLGNNNIAHSQHHIRKTMASLVAKKTHFSKFDHILLKMKLNMSFPRMLRIMIIFS